MQKTKPKKKKKKKNSVLRFQLSMTSFEMIIGTRSSTKKIIMIP
jgi:hypothetical protein